MSAESESPFRLVDHRDLADELARDGAVPIPAGLATRDALLLELAERLGFPDWFGGNWDALSDCLHDLSWTDGPVLLVHQDLPLAGTAECSIYLAVLDEAVSFWRDQPGAFAVVFPIDPDRSQMPASTLR